MSDEQELTMPTGRCPVKTCEGRNVIQHPAFSALAQRVMKAWGNTAPCPIEQCLDCGAIWEPWPEGTSIDCVERSPCDNCAYRVGSAESADPEQWKSLQAIAVRAAGLEGRVADNTPRYFSCHKGIPIDLDVKAGTISFNFEAAGIPPLQQTCAGFLKMMWAFQDKAEG